MGEYADDAIDRDFNETYGGHDWDEYGDNHLGIRRITKEHDNCPLCKGVIVARTNSKSGVKFLGCSKFPSCKFSAKK